MKKETKWSIDPSHSEIAFKVKHLMIANVRGAFRKFDAFIFTVGMDFTTAAVDLWIDASSTDTGDEKRDEHLKSPDFFDALNHKEITFATHTIGKADAEGSHEMWGGLTIKGITKKIKLDVLFGGIIKDPWGNERAGFNVSGKINRKNWELNWNNKLLSGGVMIGEDISIICEMQLIKDKTRVEVMELEALEEKIN